MVGDSVREMILHRSKAKGNLDKSATGAAATAGATVPSATDTTTVVSIAAVCAGRWGWGARLWWALCMRGGADGLP
jgi:hypothetical protein